MDLPLPSFSITVSNAAPFSFLFRNATDVFMMFRILYRFAGQQGREPLAFNEMPLQIVLIQFHGLREYNGNLRFSHFLAAEKYKYLDLRLHMSSSTGSSCLDEDYVLEWFCTRNSSSIS